MRQVLGVSAALLMLALPAACLPTPQCRTSDDCPPPQTCKDDGWCEYPNGQRLTLYPNGPSSGGASSGGTGSSGGATGCVDVATPRLESNCVANLDVLDMTAACIRINFTRADFPAVGNPTCPGFTGGKLGGFEVHATTAMDVTATISPVGAGTPRVRAEQDPAGCNTAQCTGTTATFNTAEHTRVWIETSALGDGASLVLDGRP